LGVATVVVTTFVSAAPARADCDAHANVNGYRLSYHYGTFGHVYTNKQATVNQYDAPFIRSLFAYYDSNNWVEVGWLAHDYGEGSPRVYAYWRNRGNYRSGGPQFAYGVLSYNDFYRFYVENVGHIEIWRFYFNGYTSPFTYTPTMNFDTAQPWGNSERWCDYRVSLFTDMYGLNDYTSGGTWEDWDNWAGCINGSDRNKYYLHRISSTELLVNTNSSGAMC